MASSSDVSSDLSKNLCYALGSSISIHRIYLFNSLGMSIAKPNHSFYQGPKWFTKALWILDLPSFASSAKFGSFVPINLNSYSIQRTSRVLGHLSNGMVLTSPPTLILAIFYSHENLRDRWSTIHDWCSSYTRKIFSPFWKIEALTLNPHFDSETLSPKAGIRSKIELNEKIKMKIKL